MNWKQEDIFQAIHGSPRHPRAVFTKLSTAIGFGLGGETQLAEHDLNNAGIKNRGYLCFFYEQLEKTHKAVQMIATYLENITCHHQILKNFSFSRC